MFSSVRQRKNMNEASGIKRLNPRHYSQRIISKPSRFSIALKKLLLSRLRNATLSAKDFVGVMNESDVL